jgi:hypothetical protein
MPLLDNKGRLFGKVNIFDLLVILILVLVVAFFLYKYAFQPQVDFAQDCFITLVWSNVEPDVTKWVQVGDRATDGKGNTVLEVAEVTIRPARVPVTTSDGQMLVVEHPHLKSVFIKAHAPKIAKTGIFELKGQELKIGINVIVQMDSPVLESPYKFSGLCTAIEFVPPKGSYPQPQSP